MPFPRDLLSTSAVKACHYAPQAAMTDHEPKSGPDVSKSDKRKQSLYFPEAMLEEIQKEAHRLQRSMSWVVQRAWKHARKEIKSVPGSNEPGG